MVVICLQKALDKPVQNLTSESGYPEKNIRKIDAWHCETMIQSLERQSEAKNMPFCLKMIKMASFRAVKHPYLRLKTSKLKIVESFKNFGKNFIDEELFSAFGALKT